MGACQGSEDAHAQRRGWPVDRALHRKVGPRLGRQHPGGYRWRARWWTYGNEPTTDPYTAWERIDACA